MNKSYDKVEDCIEKINSEKIEKILFYILEEDYEYSRDINVIKATINKIIENKLDSVI